MKHKFVVLLSLAILVVVPLVALGSYHGYERAKAVENQRINAATVKQQVLDQERQETFQDGVIKLEQQCSKDTAAYNALPVATRDKTPAPDCSASLVQ